MSVPDSLLPAFQAVGSRIYTSGMVSMHGGNLSTRQGDNTTITRRGSRLGFLEQDDLITTGIFKDDENTPLASSELLVHRSIYKQAHCAAIVHAHPIHSIALSFLGPLVEPQDEAGRLFIPSVPVVGFGREPTPGAFAEEIGAALKDHSVVLVHRHGCFARGMTLNEAFVFTELLEISSKILCLVKGLQGPTGT
jgi:L-fuculose-phosphate aldolase